MAYGLIVTFIAWLALWCVGEAASRAIFGRRAARVTAATRLPLGLSVTLCLLQSVGYFLPIRLAVWCIVPVAAFGALRLLHAARAGRLRRDWVLGASSLLGLGLGLVPVFIAGRFTAAAITNNDGTYYLAAADWLERMPWRYQYPTAESIPGALCLTERVLHLWMWRTGTPNLVAAVSGLSGLDSAAALAVVTPLLQASVPCAAVGLARGVRVTEDSGREWLVGVAAALSAGPAFLGFQHMTGHLGAAAIFPVACAATIAAGRRGGFRRMLHAAAYCGASLELFADGAAVLVILGLAACAARGWRFIKPSFSVAGVALLSALLIPFTVRRAQQAARMTAMNVRISPNTPVFPQRGWLPRSPLDDLSTIVGVDPWPPWPSARPLDVRTVVSWVAALCGAFLLFRGLAIARRRTGSWGPAVVLIGLGLTGVLVTPVRYLKGKILLTAACLVVPVCGVGAASLSRRRRYFVVVPFLVGEASAVAELARPSRWKVVDTPVHDQLVPRLAQVPRGSIIAFDGLGAPSDVVLDAHRAHRAALLADLQPVQPGLDGGFYLPRICPDLTAPETLPRRAYALQRVTSETLTVGTELSAWGPFKLLEVDLADPAGFVAAWAPTHGWLGAEREPNGRVFRWGESSTQGTLHVVTRASCARLRGEVRVVRGSAFLTVDLGKETAFAGKLSPEWAPFETRAFVTGEPAVLRFQVTEASAPPPDPAHAVAVSGLALDPVPSCGGVTRSAGATPSAGEGEADLIVGPPLGAQCYRPLFVVTADSGDSLRIQVDDQPPAWAAVNRSTRVALGPELSGPAAHHVRVTAATGKTLQLLDTGVRPEGCGR